MTDKNDKILQMFFEIDRWTKAIEKGVTKDIRKKQLIIADSRTHETGDGRRDVEWKVRNCTTSYRPNTQREMASSAQFM